MKEPGHPDASVIRVSPTEMRGDLGALLARILEALESVPAVMVHVDRVRIRISRED